MDSLDFLQRRFGANWRFTDNSKQYAVSNTGLLWRLSYAPHKTTTGFKTKQGFHSVGLSKGTTYRGKFYLHRLVYEIWASPIPEGFDVIHKDANKSNNHIRNLELMSHAKTLRYYSEQGRLKRGHQNTDRYQAMKTLNSLGWSQERIANAFELSQAAISQYLTEKE